MRAERKPAGRAGRARRTRRPWDWVLERLGGYRRVAVWGGWNASTVCRWGRSGVPAHAWPDLERMAREFKVAGITVETLRRPLWRQGRGGGSGDRRRRSSFGGMAVPVVASARPGEAVAGVTPEPVDPAAAVPIGARVGIIAEAAAGRSGKEFPR